MKLDIFVRNIKATVTSVYKRIASAVSYKLGLKDEEFERMREWVNEHYEGLDSKLGHVHVQIDAIVTDPLEIVRVCDVMLAVDDNGNCVIISDDN